MSFKSVMNSQKTSKQFTVLHVKSKPLVPYNGWDAGSVAAIVEVGAKAVATSSASVASAQGYEDGEYLPLDFALEIVRRIVETIDVPVTVDFEGGYSEDDGELASNISKLIELGVVGINFEDIGWSKAMGCTASVDRRIAAIRRAAEQKGIPFFINARTDVFLGQSNDVREAIERSHAYAAAGASGFFVPGLTNDDEIRRIVEQSSLPINVMVMGGVSPIDKLAELGVARVSYGPTPYSNAMMALKKDAEKLFR